MRVAPAFVVRYETCAIEFIWRHSTTEYSDLQKSRCDPASYNIMGAPINSGPLHTLKKKKKFAKEREGIGG